MSDMNETVSDADLRQFAEDLVNAIADDEKFMNSKWPITAMNISPPGFVTSAKRLRCVTIYATVDMLAVARTLAEQWSIRKANSERDGNAD